MITQKGVGTMIISFFACSCEGVLIGVLQLLTAPFIIGWVWSIMWGWECVQVSCSS
ncbi:unnamed protein product [Ascophyllum nodosum]